MIDNRSYGQTEARKWRASWLLLPLLAFLLGLAAMGWLLTKWEAAASFLGIVPAPQAAAAPMPAPAAQPVSQSPQSALRADGQTLLIDPEMQRRVGEIERRVAQIDNQTREAAGNADRAEGLLVAFAARRALDRGVALGYLEGLLQQRFAQTQPQAVATIIAASRQPITLEDLQEELQEIGPDLTGGAPNQNWWTAFKNELGGLVTVRKEGTPSTMPAERLDRAVRRLETGQVDVALAEVLRMPGRENAGAWVASARRYVGARRALDSIETAALLEPRPQMPPAPAPAQNRPIL